MKDVHRLDRLGVRLEDSLTGGLMVHFNYESSLVVEVKSKHNHDTSLMELKESVLGKLNEEFPLGRRWYFEVPRKIMCSQGR